MQFSGIETELERPPVVAILQSGWLRFVCICLHRSPATPFFMFHNNVVYLNSHRFVWSSTTHLRWVYFSPGSVYGLLYLDGKLGQLKGNMSIRQNTGHGREHGHALCSPLFPPEPFPKPWRNSTLYFCVSISPVSALLEGQEDQSILISGVSGAGKTETAKLLLGHLASVAGSEEGGVGSERIQHMVECTVVLESFGNAVMVREPSLTRLILL